MWCFLRKLYILRCKLLFCGNLKKTRIYVAESASTIVGVYPMDDRVDLQLREQR
jgi:hypothetical protein